MCGSMVIFFVGGNIKRTSPINSTKPLVAPPLKRNLRHAKAKYYHNHSPSTANNVEWVFSAKIQGILMEHVRDSPGQPMNPVNNINLPTWLLPNFPAKSGTHILHRKDEGVRIVPLFFLPFLGDPEVFAGPTTVQNPK